MDPWDLISAPAPQTAAPAAPAAGWDAVSSVQGDRAPVQITVRPSAPEASAPTAQPSQPGSDDGVNGAVGAAAGGFVRGIPIVGPYIDEGVKRAAAGVASALGENTYDEALAAIRKNDAANSAAHPNLETAGNVVGAVTSMIPLGATALGARALGIEGPTLLGRVAAGGASGAAINSADSAARGEDPLKGGIVGGVVGGAVPVAGAAISRAISPIRATASRQALTNTLDNEGVHLTAGDRTGSKPLRWLESSLGDMPGAGGAIAAVKDQQGQQFTAAALRRAGINSPLATPDVLQAANQRIGNVFETLSARHTLNYDRQFANDLATTVSRYDRKLPSQQREVFHNIINDIVMQQGRMPGAMYQTTRSDLTKMVQGLRNSDHTLSESLRGVRDALDNAMGRSIPAADQAAWQTARREWGHLKTIEKAMSGAGERTAEGYLSPSQLRNAVAVNNRGAYARGQGDMAELARAGEGILKPLPNSGTAPRSYMQHVATALSSGTGFAAGGPVGAAVGFLSPGLLARLLLSRPVQGYLGNQVAGRGVERAATQAVAGPAVGSEVAVSERRRDRSVAR